MSHRRTFLRSLVKVAFAFPLAVRGQTPRRIWRIGFASASEPPRDGLLPASLRQALRELGYVDGENAVLLGRWAHSVKEQLPALATELVALKPDVIVAFGSGTAAMALKGATSSIPIVFVAAGDPVGAGLVASLSRPGGNLTGISAQATDLSAKRLELLVETVPHAARVAVLWNADDVAMTLRFKEIERAAPLMHVSIQPLGVREPNDFEAAFAKMSEERPDGLLLVVDSLTLLNRKRVLDFAAIHDIPDLYEFGSLVREGGLMSYGPDLDDLLRRGAVFVDRILKGGAKPADLPVEQPTRYYLVVNLARARKLGLTVPQGVLLQADEVIQ